MQKAESITIELPKEIVDTLHEKGIYDIEKYIVELIERNSEIRLTKEEENIIEENLKGLGYI